MSSPPLLDAELARHWSTPAQELPLALRRLQETSGTLSAHEAIESAAETTLSVYEQRFGLGNAISVGRLCDIMGAELSGPLPRRRATPTYSSAPVAFRRHGHKAELRVDTARPRIVLNGCMDESLARVSVAHELGHLFVHRRGSSLDRSTLRLGTSPEEEAIAEYAARLLLLPRSFISPFRKLHTNTALQAVELAARGRVTLHAAVVRLGGPDIADGGLQAAILWEMKPHTTADRIEQRLTPQWFACPGAFVPVGTSSARPGSLVARLAEDGGEAV